MVRNVLKNKSIYFLPIVFLFMKVCSFCTVLVRMIYANK